jgi:broad specificity phosphatase PhoE
MLASDIRTRLLLLRCGAMTWAGGPGDESTLSATGLAAVELVAATLPRFDHIAASRSGPARETAETIGLVRGVTPAWDDDLGEVRSAVSPVDAQSYDAWLDRLFEPPHDAGGESLTEGGARLAAALRRIGDRSLGRIVLIVSHPVILLAFRSHQMRAPLTRGHVDAMPDLALATVDYLQGRFYIVADFAVRWTAPQATG